MLLSPEQMEQVELTPRRPAPLDFEAFRRGVPARSGQGLAAPIGDWIKNGPEMGERGLHADLKALITADDVPAEGDQLDLGIFDDFTSPVAERLADRGVAIRRPGRPQGSKSRTNLNIVQLIRATKRPTLLTLKEWADLNLTEFMAATGISDAGAAWHAWFKVAELVTAYEEGRPAQRLEMDVKGGGPIMPVVVFGDVPVRPDLVEGNGPRDDQLLNVTTWSDASTNDTDQGEGAQPKAHDDGESQWSPDREP
jgi:hypothetical protein